jgi:hypothetical protein
MTVEAVPVGATSVPARLYLLTVGVGEQATGSPASVGVQAGTEVIANVGIPWNSTASATFALEISIVPLTGAGVPVQPFSNRVSTPCYLSHVAAPGSLSVMSSGGSGRASGGAGSRTRRVTPKQERPPTIEEDM